MTKVIIGSLLALSLALTFVEGGQDKCEIRGKGKLASYSNNRVNIKVPCKYRATVMECGGYKIRVAPGQRMDSKIRYYIDTAWVTIKKMDTDFYWIGRISAQRVDKYFEDPSRELFSTKEENMDGAPFSVQYEGDENTWSGSVSVNDANFKVTYYGYDEKDKQKRKRAGIVITCPDATFPDLSTYPGTFCGNDSDVKAITNRRKSLSLGSKSKSVIYDVLNNDEVRQNLASCDIASRVFRTCAADKVQTIKDCSPLVSNVALMKCLKNNGQESMDAFNFCLKYRCENDAESCVLLQEQLENCNTGMSVAKEQCPKLLDL